MPFAPLLAVVAAERQSAVRSREQARRTAIGRSSADAPVGARVNEIVTRAIENLETGLARSAAVAAVAVADPTGEIEWVSGAANTL